MQALTYTLLPGPVPTHKVVVLPFSTLKVFVWCIVETRGKLEVCEDMVKNFSGITIPDLVFGSHPLWYRTVIGTEPLVLGSIQFPGDVA